MTRPMTKSYSHEGCGKSPAAECFRRDETYADEFVQEDAAEVRARRNVEREHACGAVGGEHDGVKFAGGRKDVGGLLHVHRDQRELGGIVQSR